MTTEIDPGDLSLGVFSILIYRPTDADKTPPNTDMDEQFSSLDVVEVQS